MIKSKFSVLLLAFILFTVVGCKPGEAESDVATIKADILNADGRQVFLEDVNGNSAFVIDTAVVKNNKAVLSADVHAGLYRIRFPELRNIQGPLLFLDNESRLELSIDTKVPTEYRLTGDAENELLRKTLKRQDQLAKESIGYKSTIRNTSDNALRTDANNKLMNLVTTSEAEVKQTIEESKSMDPNLTAFLLNLIDPNTNAAYIANELKSLKELDPDSKLIAQMESRFTVVQQRKSSGIAIGTTAPEIVQNNPAGKPIALSSLRGKYVLIDFWASWCKPCRFENPNVVRTYHEYKDRGFDVFSVSLDKSKDRWEKAIEADDLVWSSHVSDLKAWGNEAARSYGVSSIPATFLIDPEGKVIARNLRGPALEQKLKEVLGDS